MVTASVLPQTRRRACRSRCLNRRLPASFHIDEGKAVGAERGRFADIGSIADDEIPPRFSAWVRAESEAEAEDSILPLISWRLST